MYPQRVRWHRIGLCLGFPLHILECIGDKYRQNDQRLEKMLLEWLRRRNFQPSWQSLIDALNHPTVGGEGAADDIRKYVLSKAAEGARDAPLKTMRGGLDLPIVTLKKPGDVDKEEQKVDPMAATLELIRKGNFALRPVDPANVSPKTDEMPRLLDYQPREPSPINIPRMVMKPPDAYSARLYMDTPVPGGPCSRAVFCIVPYQPVYTAFMDAYMEKMEPGMKTSADYVEQPVEFEDSSTEAAVVLELPRETPGYKIIPDQEPLTIYKKHVDHVFLSSTNRIQEGPPKLALNISPEGGSATSSSTSWDLNVLGLEDDLIFTLTFPAHSAYTADRLLTLDDFQAVYEKLYPLRGKWHFIGVQLGISLEHLDNYEDDYRNNHQCLRMVILDWLRRRKLRPTWKALIEALRHETVGDEGAAHDLQELVMMGTQPAGSPNSSLT